MNRTLPIPVFVAWLDDVKAQVFVCGFQFRRLQRRLGRLPAAEYHCGRLLSPVAASFSLSQRKLFTVETSLAYPILSASGQGR
jgi:hypothetical protein